MLHTHNKLTNLIELTLYTGILIYICIILKCQTTIYIQQQQKTLTYEKHKKEIYTLIVEKTDIRSPFEQIFLNRNEILETLMYNQMPTEIITGKPNKSRNIEKSFEEIKKQISE